MGVAFGTHLTQMQNIPDDHWVICPLYRRGDVVGIDAQPGLLTGGVMRGENSIAAAVREMEEELGLRTDACPTHVSTITRWGHKWHTYRLSMNQVYVVGASPVTAPRSDYTGSKVDMRLRAARSPSTAGTKEERYDFASFRSLRAGESKQKVILIIHGSHADAIRLRDGAKDVEREENDIIGSAIFMVGHIRDAFKQCHISECDS